jgi:hypothetical protein
VDSNLVLIVIGVIVLGGLAAFVVIFRQQSEANRKLVDSIRDLVPVNTLRDVYNDAYNAALTTKDTKLDDFLVQLGGKLASIVSGQDVTTLPQQPVPTETTTVVAPAESVVTIETPPAV